MTLGRFPHVRSTLVHTFFSLRSAPFSDFISPSLSGLSYISSEGSIKYARPDQLFPYFEAPPLPLLPEQPHKYMFNANPLSKSNPFGLITEGCSHKVYRAKSSATNKVHYLKDLSQWLETKREPATAHYLAYQESFACWLMIQLFGPFLIPVVQPLRLGNQWGLSSSEIKYYKTLTQSAQDCGLSSTAIFYGESAMKVKEGRTYINTQDYGEVRVMGRIALKVALRMLVAHYDAANHSNNICMVLAPDSRENRLVACPGTFDLGMVFAEEQMEKFILACEKPESKKVLVSYLAENSVDSDIPELNVADSDEIFGHSFTKYKAYERVATFPRESLEKGLAWFQSQAPQTEIARQKIEGVKRFLACSLDLSKAVAETLAKKIRKEVLPDFKPPTLG